jgi:hypothetical protein
VTSSKKKKEESFWAKARKGFVLVNVDATLYIESQRGATWDVIRNGK